MFLSLLFSHVRSDFDYKYSVEPVNQTNITYDTSDYTVIEIPHAQRRTAKEVCEHFSFWDQWNNTLEPGVIIFTQKHNETCDYVPKKPTEKDQRDGLATYNFIRWLTGYNRTFYELPHDEPNRPVVDAACQCAFFSSNYAFLGHNIGHQYPCQQKMPYAAWGCGISMIANYRGHKSYQHIAKNLYDESASHLGHRNGILSPEIGNVSFCKSVTEIGGTQAGGAAVMMFMFFDEVWNNTGRQMVPESDWEPLPFIPVPAPGYIPREFLPYYHSFAIAKNGYAFDRHNFSVEVYMNGHPMEFDINYQPQSVFSYSRSVAYQLRWRIKGMSSYYVQSWYDNRNNEAIALYAPDLEFNYRVHDHTNKRTFAWTTYTVDCHKDHSTLPRRILYATPAPTPAATETPHMTPAASPTRTISPSRSFSASPKRTLRATLAPERTEIPRTGKPVWSREQAQSKYPDPTFSPGPSFKEPNFAAYKSEMEAAAASAGAAAASAAKGEAAAAKVGSVDTTTSSKPSGAITGALIGAFITVLVVLAIIDFFVIRHVVKHNQEHEDQDFEIAV